MEKLFLFSISFLRLSIYRPRILLGSECLALSELFGPLPISSYPNHPNFLLLCVQLEKGNLDLGVGGDVPQISPEYLQKAQAVSGPNLMSPSSIPVHHKDVQNPH